MWLVLYLGMCNSQFLDGGATGATGATGPTGVVGATGHSITGITGNQGLMGTIGQTGSSGVLGTSTRTQMYYDPQQPPTVSANLSSGGGNILFDDFGLQGVVTDNVAWIKGCGTWTPPGTVSPPGTYLNVAIPLLSYFNALPVPNLAGSGFLNSGNAITNSIGCTILFIDTQSVPQVLYVPCPVVSLTTPIQMCVSVTFDASNF